MYIKLSYKFHIFPANKSPQFTGTTLVFSFVYTPTFTTRGYKTFSSSTQLSMKFQQVIKLKCWKLKTFLAPNLSDGVNIMLINVKMSTIVGILTLIMINFMLSWVENKSLITSGSGLQCQISVALKPWSGSKLFAKVIKRQQGDASKERVNI